LIVSAYPDGEEALLDNSSPQFAAFEWLLSPANGDILSNRRLVQRYALATLFYSTRGNEWTISSQWLSSVHECSWYTSVTDVDICDTQGNYVVMGLQQNNLRGTLPMEILTLSDTLGESTFSVSSASSYLYSHTLSERLQLHDNEISGFVPPTIAGLTVLGMSLTHF
jgi:hypothetical protein